MNTMFVMAQTQLAQGLRREEGQGLVEYALILAFIAIVIIVALTFLQEEISSIFSEIGSALQGED